MKAFILSQFSFSPLIGMLHSRDLNYKINSLHHRALKMVYKDYTSSFEDLLKRGGSVSVHHRNVQFLATELFKVKLGLTPPFMEEIFRRRNFPENSVAKNLRSQIEFYNYHNPKTVHYGLETLRHLGPKIWNIIPENIKNSATLASFKMLIKKWVPKDCPCRLCRNYVKGLGFI